MIAATSALHDCFTIERPRCSGEHSQRPVDDRRAVTVVIPTYNVPPVDRLLALDIAALRIRVVDDNSSDGPGQVADRLAGITAGRASVRGRPREVGTRLPADTDAGVVIGTRYVTGGSLDALTRGLKAGCPKRIDATGAFLSLTDRFGPRY